jgi:hypothetical protein
MTSDAWSTGSLNRVDTSLSSSDNDLRLCILVEKYFGRLLAAFTPVY